MKKRPTDYNDIPEITLPQMITAIVSMLTFFAFLIALYVNYYPHVFFAVWIWIIAGSIIYSGIKKKKSDRTKAIIYIVSGALIYAGGLVIVIINLHNSAAS